MASITVEKTNSYVNGKFHVMYRDEYEMRVIYRGDWNQCHIYAKQQKKKLKKGKEVYVSKTTIEEN